MTVPTLLLPAVGMTQRTVSVSEGINRTHQSHKSEGGTRKTGKALAILTPVVSQIAMEKIVGCYNLCLTNKFPAESRHRPFILS